MELLTQRLDVPLIEILRSELKARGWREMGLQANRAVRGWKHPERQIKAASLTDAIVQQLVFEVGP